MDELLTSADIRKLKSRAQTLKATLKIGRAGLSDAFLQAVDDALAREQLIKVKFDELKDQRKVLAPRLAQQTRSRLVTLIGHVAVLYRRQPPAPAGTPGPAA